MAAVAGGGLMLWRDWRRGLLLVAFPLFLFLFLGARPCTEWLGETVARDDDGFILTGRAAGAAHLLETSVPGLFAAGDVRAGAMNRVASAVGEGSMVVRVASEYLALI